MTATLDVALRAAFDRRLSAATALGADAAAVAAACEAMAERFRAGGTLLVFGCGVGAADAAHVAVEFVHPVIVGKRALPALSLTSDVASLTGIAARDPDDMLAAPLRLLARPGDIALALSGDGTEVAVRRALTAAKELGLLTVALAGGDGGDLAVDRAADRAVDHLLLARSADPQVVKEVHVTTYHVLWELTHVFLEQPADRAATGGAP